MRSRSGALIDDDLKIDFNADTVLQTQRLGRSLANVRTILFTHQHPDHVAPREMQVVAKPTPAFTLPPRLTP